MKRFIWYFLVSTYLLLTTYSIYAAVPVMTDTNREITLDVYDLAGRSMTAAGGKVLFYCFGEPGGITKYVASGKDMQAGYYSQIFPPGAVTNLSALVGIYGRTIRLNWTAPGEDGYGGIISSGQYAIQRSTYDAGLVNWATAYAQIAFSTANVSPGEWQWITITSLRPGVTYYFRIWTQNIEGEWSEMSNITTNWAELAILSIMLVEPNTWYSFGTLPTNFTTSSVSGIIVRNNGTLKQRYTLRLTTGPPYTIWNSSTIAGNNQFVLYTVGRASQPAIGSFGELEGNDILTLWDIDASIKNFNVDGETPIATNREPYKPPDITDTALTDCTFWFKFRTPLAVSTTNWQTIPIVFTAIEE